MAKDQNSSFDAEDLKAALQANERDRLHAALKELEEKKKQKGTRIRLLYGLGAVAAAAAIALLIIFVGLPRFAPSPGDLFARYYEPAANVLEQVERGETQVEAPADTAISFGREFPTTTSDQSAEQIATDFYTANDLLAEGKAEAAIPLLKDMAGHHSDFGRAATWYLALAYLKLADLDQAKPLFQAMIDEPNHPYHKESKVILQHLTGG